MTLTQISDLYRQAEHVGNAKAKLEASLAFEYYRVGKVVQANRLAYKAKKLLSVEVGREDKDREEDEHFEDLPRTGQCGHSE